VENGQIAALYNTKQLLIKGQLILGATEVEVDVNLQRQSVGQFLGVGLPSGAHD
jgi:hypothetical protein